VRLPRGDREALLLVGVEVVGTFDGIRPSDWEGEESEEYIYFTGGRIGDVPQVSFGFPAAQRREFRVL
jgi:hypothetical protein